jgi:tyrosyl-tRNA synthetase
MGSVTVKRPAKFGGDRTFSGYPDLERAYAAGEVHPLDLKTTTAACLADVLAPVRDRLG